MNCLSVTYKTVPVEVRERLSFTKKEQKECITALIKKNVVHECVVLSTCNRSELYFDGDLSSICNVQMELAKQKGIPTEKIMKYFYSYCDDSAIRHLYKVAAGMDSMILGEDEILGQLKDAFFLARELNATGFYFNTLFQGAITCAKKIKTDTSLSKLSVSVGTLAAHEVFRFEKEGIKNVLIIGITGKMGTIVMKNIASRPDVKVTGTVRSHASITKLADATICQIDYTKRYQAMEEADIVISVTTSPHYTVTYGELAEVLITKKKRLFLDLSVPLDIDKEITRIDGVVLHDIDYFTAKSKENNNSKLRELDVIEDLLEEYISEVKKTIQFHQFLEHIPRVKKVFEHHSMEQILYQLRDQNSCEEFATILKALKDLE